MSHINPKRINTDLFKENHFNSAGSEVAFAYRDNAEPFTKALKEGRERNKTMLNKSFDPVL
jgi:hypothetical protein